jgi:hypothetical protein
MYDFLNAWPFTVAQLAKQFFDNDPEFKGSNPAAGGIERKKVREYLHSSINEEGVGGRRRDHV